MGCHDEFWIISDFWVRDGQPVPSFQNVCSNLFFAPDSGKIFIAVSYNAFIWFWYQTSADFYRGAGKCSPSSVVSESLWNISINSFWTVKIGQ